MTSPKLFILLSPFLETIPPSSLKIHQKKSPASQKRDTGLMVSKRLAATNLRRQPRIVINVIAFTSALYVRMA